MKKRTDLYGADLTGADLTHADLTGANLRGADIRYADLYGRKTEPSNVRGYADMGHPDGDFHYKAVYAAHKAPAATTPEPPPTGDGEDVTLALIEELAETGGHGKLVRDLIERRQFGIDKYGTPLRTHNGRRHMHDAYQEVLDLVVYLKASCMENDEGWGYLHQAVDLATSMAEEVA